MARARRTQLLALARIWAYQLVVQCHPLRSGGYGRRGCRHGIDRSLDPTPTQTRIRMASGTRLGTQHRVQCWCRRRQCAYQCLVRIGAQGRRDSRGSVGERVGDRPQPAGGRDGHTRAHRSFAQRVRAINRRRSPIAAAIADSERGRRPGLSRAVHW